VKRFSSKCSAISSNTGSSGQGISLPDSSRLKYAFTIAVFAFRDWPPLRRSAFDNDNECNSKHRTVVNADSQHGNAHTHVRESWLCIVYHWYMFNLCLTTFMFYNFNLQFNILHQQMLRPSNDICLRQLLVFTVARIPLNARCIYVLELAWS
jgi:hypothetical protein